MEAFFDEMMGDMDAWMDDLPPPPPMDGPPATGGTEGPATAEMAQQSGSGSDGPSDSEGPPSDGPPELAQ